MMAKIAPLVIVILILSVLLVPGAEAQGSATIQNPLNATSISGFLKDVFRAIVKIGLPIVVLFIVYSGFLFIKARGNSTELATAKRNFLYVVLGTTIFLGAWALAEMIALTLKGLGV
ncbi:MAG TPA: TrbC/VirB2 family protein [Candidatus Paceibacterota bacterium]